MLENASSNTENLRSNEHKSSDVSDTCPSDSKSGQSFTFEAQVGLLEVLFLLVSLLCSYFENL